MAGYWYNFCSIIGKDLVKMVCERLIINGRADYFVLTRFLCRNFKKLDSNYHFMWMFVNLRVPSLDLDVHVVILAVTYVHWSTRRNRLLCFGIEFGSWYNADLKVRFFWGYWWLIIDIKPGLVWFVVDLCFDIIGALFIIIDSGFDSSTVRRRPEDSGFGSSAESQDLVYWH